MDRARALRRWYRPGELSRILGVTGETVRSWFRAGLLPNVAGPRYYAVTGAELERVARTEAIPGLTAGWMAQSRSASRKVE